MNISTWIDLLSEPLPVSKVLPLVSGDATYGGIVTFLGATRHQTDPKHGELLRLEYEAYGEMALHQMHRLCDESRSRWDVGPLVMIHRIGAVGLGEVSVAIAVACPHRAEAFEACRWLIDTLKNDVPIWKKDVFADGFTRWVDPTRPQS